MKNKLSILATSIILAACGSSAPSESDVAKNINKSFENCEIAIIKDIKKINGEEGRDKNSYFVDLSFKLIFKEAEGARRLLADLESIHVKSEAFTKERLAKMDALNQVSQDIANREMQELEQVLAEVKNRPVDPANFRESLRQIEVDKNQAYQDVKVKYAEIYRREVTEKEYEIRNNPEDLKNDSEAREVNSQLSKINADYKNKCFVKDKFIGRTFLLSNVDLGNAYLGKEYNVEFKQVPMKKTENGWLFNL